MEPTKEQLWEIVKYVCWSHRLIDYDDLCIRLKCHERGRCFASSGSERDYEAAKAAIQAWERIRHE